MQYDTNQPGMDGGESMPQGDKRSEPMTAAAIVFSIVAICTICCVYSSIICGSLGIIFALLSKGGELTMSQNSKAALILSAIAIGLTVLLTAASFAAVILRFGSLDAFLKAYLELINAYSAGLQ